MIPASFEYLSPRTVDEAVAALSQLGDDAKLLSGGHSLIPAMKLRLAQPKALVDLGRIPDLKVLRLEGETVLIGAGVTHGTIERDPLIKSKCPLLAEVACEVGDVQVRNRGTLGGSIVHADPAADWPAAMLASQVKIEVAGPQGRRIISAEDFFVDMMQTALAANEILCAIRVPVTGPMVSYVKSKQKASGFAVAGVAVVMDGTGDQICVGVTGVAATPYRARAVEAELQGQELSDELLNRAAVRAAEGVEPLGDIHASPEYRAHLAAVNTRRALARALGRV